MLKRFCDVHLPLNNIALARLSGNLHVVPSATAGWKFKQAGLLCESRHALGADLLHVLPAEDQMSVRYRAEDTTHCHRRLPGH